jgi:polyisoprenyl-phosphate glycosyltransferase
MTKPFLSIVTPTFNEEATILECIRKVSEVMSGLENQVSYEHVIIDNASTDHTLELALDAARFNPHLVVACNDRWDSKHLSWAFVNER